MIVMQQLFIILWSNSANYFNLLQYTFFMHARLSLLSHVYHYSHKIGI